MEVTNMKKTPMKVYFFADLIGIYFTTLGCREEKNGKRRTTQEMPTCSSNPQKLAAEFPPIHNQWKSHRGQPSRERQEWWVSACDPPASDTTICLEPEHQTWATSWWESAGRNLPCGSYSTCPPKRWMQSPSMQQLSWTWSTNELLLFIKKQAFSQGITHFYFLLASLC